MDVLTLLFIIFLVLFVAFITLCMMLIYTTSPTPIVKRYAKEKLFISPPSGIVKEFPSLQEPASVDLSIIIPAYDEESRLPPMLDECLQYLEERVRENPTWTYEIIVVDDGSQDKTTSTAHMYTQKYGSEKVRVLTLLRNRGKGGAVRLGVDSARGNLLLFADADGATKFSDYAKLEDAMLKLVGEKSLRVGQNLPAAIVCGSRAHLEKDSIAKRSIFRTVLMYGFHFLVWFFAVKDVKDTQCGFKLFTRQAARICFASLHIERWAFDVELLYVAQKYQIPVDEVAVTWTEIEGSKVVPFWSWLQMGRDLILLWLRYQIGAWKLVKVE